MSNESIQEMLATEANLEAQLAKLKAQRLIEVQNLEAERKALADKDLKLRHQEEKEKAIAISKEINNLSDQLAAKILELKALPLANSTGRFPSGESRSQVVHCSQSLERINWTLPYCLVELNSVAIQDRKYFRKV